MSDTEHSHEHIEAVLDAVEDFLEHTLGVMDVQEDFTYDLAYLDGVVQCQMDGDPDDVALVIGKRGQTLDAIQYLTNAILINQFDEPIPANFDVQGYRERRAVQLQKQADKVLSAVARKGRRVEMEPMTSSERKVVHLYLREHEEVETASLGREPMRRVVVYPAHGNR